MESAGVTLEGLKPLAAQQAIKRMLDVLGALSGLIILSPLFSLLAILIKLDSPGPVFFVQNRIGLRGRTFKLWKFRSMMPDDDDRLAEGLAKRFLEDPSLRLNYENYQKLWDDPRLTQLGRFLRRSSLDELPQLWNVLRGEMSLVGPRPFLPEQAALYGPACSLYSTVRPGLTGLWQISGRNQLSFAERVRFDQVYLKNWSLETDLEILLKTIPVVLKQHGAC